MMMSLSGAPGRLGYYRAAPGALSIASSDHALGKTLHLFKLRTALKQEEIYANRLELGNAFRNLVRCSDESRAQSPITNGIIFKRDVSIEFCASQPLPVIRIASGGLINVGNTCKFFLRFLFRVTNNRISGDSKSHTAYRFLFSSLVHLSDRGADALCRIPIHLEGTAGSVEQPLRGSGFAASVNHGPRL